MKTSQTSPPPMKQNHRNLLDQHVPLPCVLRKIMITMQSTWS